MEETPTENVFADVQDAQRSQLIFNFLDYLQDLKAQGLDEDAKESVDVASQCLGSAFGVDLNDDSQRKQLSIKPQTVPTVFGLGLAGKAKISNALQRLVCELTSCWIQCHLPFFLSLFFSPLFLFVSSSIFYDVIYLSYIFFPSLFGLSFFPHFCFLSMRLVWMRPTT